MTDAPGGRPSRKFDPARAERLDAPEREEYLPDDRLSAAGSRAEPVLISANRVLLPDGSVDRVIAVNLLHEVRGETALDEIRRLLRPDGVALVADWARGRDPERPLGPPEEILYTEEEAVEKLERAGFRVERADGGFPYHFVLLAHPADAP